MERPSLRHRKNPVPARLALRAAMIAMAIMPAQGCRTWERIDQWTNGGWMPHFDTAERAAWRNGRPLLIAFEDTKAKGDDRLVVRMNDPRLRAMVEGHVRCALLSSHEPDRRFVQQYGVRRAPALILAHTDGTYHAMDRPGDVGAMMAFLQSATPPGHRPTLNPLIPRRDAADWYSDLESARQEALRTGRLLFVAYERAGVSDPVRLRQLLAEREVTQRTADMVHARIGVFHWGGVMETPFGPIRPPAIVVVNADGVSRVIESPISAEAVARFVAESRRALAAREGPTDQP